MGSTDEWVWQTGSAPDAAATARGTADASAAASAPLVVRPMSEHSLELLHGVALSPRSVTRLAHLGLSAPPFDPTDSVARDLSLLFTRFAQLLHPSAGRLDLFVPLAAHRMHLDA